MALKKPGDFFQRKEVVKIKEEIDQLVNPELSSLSDAFDNYKEKVNKFELLSGVIEDVQKELKDIKIEVYKKEELEETVIKSSLLLEKKIKELKEDVEKESKNVLNISSIKYRKLEEEVKKYHDKALSVIENEVGKIEQGQKSYNSKLASIKSEIFRTEDLKKVTEKVKEDLAEFQKVDYDISEKIKYMEEVFVKFNEQVTLKENVITEPPSTNNSDPLTPLDQNFVTFEQLSEHYRIFINRIQQQLSTLGGGGSVRIQDMDDIDRDSVLVNNRVLKYDADSKRFVGTNAGSQSLDDTLSIGNTSSHGMFVGVVTATKFVGSGLGLTGLIASQIPTLNQDTTGTAANLSGTPNISVGNVNATGHTELDDLNVVGLSTFNDDVTFAGANHNIRFDKSLDDLIFDDNAKLTFGIGSTTVNLFYKPDTRDFRHEFSNNANYVLLTDTFDLKDANGSNKLITAFGNNGTDNYVRLSHNGNERLRTTGIGVTIRNHLDTTNIVASGIVTATDFNSTSDVKLKKNIKQIEDPISKIMSIEGVSFNWKSDNRPSLGVIADQLENTLPELVNNDDPKTVNYNGLVGLLIECVKNQQKQIDELKDQLNN